MLRLILVVLVLTLLSSTAAYGRYELESCQWGGAVPPGLDEPLNCDHKCFLEELGKDVLTAQSANLHQLYSIGWRLVQIVEAEWRGETLWHVYIERDKTGPPNSCDEIYSPETDPKMLTPPLP